MARRTGVAAVVVSSVISAALGFWFGVRQGSMLALWADSAARGVIATGFLRALPDSEYENLRILNEANVDQGLINLRNLDHSPFKNMLAPIWGFPDYSVYEEYGYRLAAYRESNPSPLKYEDVHFRPEIREAYPELYQQAVEAGRETARALAEAIDHYGKKP